jgi:hypothetical protein
MATPHIYTFAIIREIKLVVRQNNLFHTFPYACIDIVNMDSHKAIHT